MSDSPLNLSTLRAKLEASGGRTYWRSLEEVADEPEFQEMLQREFPEQASEWGNAFSRRNFLKMMAASLALAGLQGCTKEPQERIVPYVRPPANLVAGRAMHFASAMPLRGVGLGVLVTSREGRPIKIEGNPDHPESLGAANVFMQASILGLYDPDRSQVPIHLGDVSSWSAFQTALAPVIAAKRLNGGAGLRILTQTITSPTLLAQLQTILKEFPEAKWHRYEPMSRDAVHAGASAAFGKRLDPIYHFDKAEVILSLGSDFLFAESGSLRYSRQFVDKRRVRTLGENGRPIDPKTATMNRLYVSECMPSLTGAMADHRLPLKPSEIGLLATAIAKELGASSHAQATTLPASTLTWAKTVARDLMAHRGRALVLVGESQPAEIHALGYAMNALLGAFDTTITFIEPIDPHPDSSAESLKILVEDINANKVDTLLMLGSNPVYTAPVDLNFLSTLKRVKLRIHLGEASDETAFQCQWHLPETHYLEAWSDVRAFDGTTSIVQPLIAPLYQNKSAHEVLSILSGRPDVSGYEVVRSHWLNMAPTGDFETWWKSTLQKGIIEGSASPSQAVKINALPVIAFAAASTGLEILYALDSTVYDGRYANNGWLQELPKPLTHMSWDNAAMLSPRTAEKQGLQSRDVVELTSGGRMLRVAVWVLPGHADDAVTISLGYGRTRAGRVGGTDKYQLGFNANLLRDLQHPQFAGDLQIAKTGKNYKLVVSRTHHTVESRSLSMGIKPEVVAHPEDSEKSDNLQNRKLIRVATLAEFQSDPQFAQKMEEEGSGEKAAGGKRVPLPQLFPEIDYSTKSNPAKHKWAMSIDTSSCIGCNACVIACQAENNIPVVGKDQVERGREMHWIRIDTYYAGSLDDPETYFQPLPCMHCENAPCELVCPVEATVHDDEGINNMVYNRCIGTRYCSNNCPYKVRRFNFLQYTDQTTEQYKLMRNPEVTVRSRGVMEKCTFCIQRINNTRIDLETLQVRMEEQIRNSTSSADRAQLQNTLDETARHTLTNLETACQQSCPTQAIIFGDQNVSLSPIALLKQEPLDYSLLEELTTKPRTTYLARLRNPNVELNA